MEKFLTVLTPCSEKKYLINLYFNLISYKNYIKNWYIITDSEDPKVLPFTDDFIVHVSIGDVYKKWKKKIDYALDLIEDNTWLYTISEKNIIHPDFFREIDKHLSSGKNFIAFPVYVGERILSPKLNDIYKSQYIVQRNFLGELRYSNNYLDDETLVPYLYKQDSDKFLVLETAIGYYEYLDW